MHIYVGASILRLMQSSSCASLQCAATTEEDNHEWLARAWNCATVAYSKSTRSVVINHSRSGRERKRRLRKSTVPPINVNDLFLQRASRCITISSVIVLALFALLCTGLLFLFLPNETNFQRARNVTSRIQRHRFIINFTFSVGHVRPFSTSSDVNKCFPR